MMRLSALILLLSALLGACQSLSISALTSEV